MAKNFKRSDTHLPKRVMDLLNREYLQKDEKIVDAIHETYVPRFDFRWILLTNQRVIVAIRHLIQIEFQAVLLEELTLEFTRGVFFDTLDFTARTSNYHGNLYSFDRPYTISFITKFRKVAADYAQAKQKGMSEVTLQPVQTLEDLQELKSKGEISEEEYQKLTKEVLENLKKE